MISAGAKDGSVSDVEAGGTNASGTNASGADVSGTDVSGAGRVADRNAASLVFVGGGPKTTGILLALAAAARRDPASVPARLDIEVVDPFPAGGGRIWREDQAEVLWMNSLTRDITIFSELPGAITGPTLDDWIAENLDASEFVAPDGFAPRHVQARYLGWTFDRAVAALPEGWSVRVHEGTAVHARRVAVAGADAGYAVRVRPGGAAHVARRDGRVHAEPIAATPGAGDSYELTGDAVILAQGFVEVEPDLETGELTRAAERLGLGYVPPGYTADLDLSVLPAGADVLVRGFGLAFIDAMMMVTEGRGGRFTPTDKGVGHRVDYVPSSREPVLWVGSRRGVPLMPKLGYSVPGLGLGPARFITEENLRALGEATSAAVSAGTLPEASSGTGGDLRAGPVFDLLRAEMAAAHYAFLAGAHPERAAGGVAGYLDPIADYVAAVVAREDAAARTAWRALEEFAADHVPESRDRFDLEALDRPLHHGAFALPAGGEFADAEAGVASVISARLERAEDPHFAQDAAVFAGLVSAYLTLREFVAQGYFDAGATAWIETRVHGFFSYIASGPPPERLENLLALHRAGLVRFTGPDMEIGVAERGGDATGDGAAAFTGRSSSHGTVLRAGHLLDARLSHVVAAQAKDSLLQSLIRAGELLLTGDGKFVADTRGHALDARGVPQDALFMVGPAVSGSVAEAFSRPGTNARVFRDNEQLAGTLLEVVERTAVGAAVA